MGAIQSKKNIKKRTSRRRASQPTVTHASDTPDVYWNIEPVYEELDGNLKWLRKASTSHQFVIKDVDVSTGSHLTIQSLDSAFHDRSPSDTSLSSCNIYDTPGRSETHPKTYCHNGDGGGVDGGGEQICDRYTSVPPSCNGRTPKKCGGVPLEEVPYMVEAFQPLIEQTVNVMEVVIHMPFLDAGEFVNKESTTEAVALLIARTKLSDEPGKWQAFLYALNEAGYEYIVQLLRGETDEDHTINRNLLKLFTPQIMNRIDPDEFIDHLFEKSVINERDMEEVGRERDRRGAIAASFMLLHKVPRRLCNWYEIFLDVLKKCGMQDMVEQFKIPEVCKWSVAANMPSDIKPKLKVAEENVYITPICDKETKIASLPSPTPRLVPTALPSRHASGQTYKDVDSRSRSSLHSKSESDILKGRAEELKRLVEEKILIKQYKAEVKRLQRELEHLTTDEVGSVVEHNIGDGLVTSEQIASLFTDMKQELKREIWAMRDHVTEAVLKSIISSRSLPAYEDTAYVTTLNDQMKLYDIANITSCGGLLRPQRHQLYSVDSAIYSDYGYNSAPFVMPLDP